MIFLYKYCQNLLNLHLTPRKHIHNLLNVHPRGQTSFQNSLNVHPGGQISFQNPLNVLPRGQMNFQKLLTPFSSPKVLINLNLLTQPTQKRTGHNLSPAAISVFRHMSGYIPARFRDAGWQSYPKAINRGVPRHFPRNHSP